jgi:hypothetical protein
MPMHVRGMGELLNVWDVGTEGMAVTGGVHGTLLSGKALAAEPKHKHGAINEPVPIAASHRPWTRFHLPPFPRRLFVVQQLKQPMAKVWPSS